MVQENIVLTPRLLWQNFEPDGELNVNVVREWREENLIFREVYFSASVACDGITRVYGLLVVPKSTNPCPAILYCHNVSQTIDIEFMKGLARKGYAVFGCDYSGESDGSHRYTIYPKSLDFANYVRSDRHLTHVDETIRETVWYEWTVNFRYAVKFMLAQSEIDRENIGVIGIRGGGYFVWQLTSFCENIKAGVSLFEGGFSEYAERGAHKYSARNEIEIDDNMQRWLAGGASQAYAQHVKTPILYVGATNDFLGCCDRVSDTLQRIEDVRYCFCPRLTSTITESSYRMIENFFAAKLKGKEKDFKTQPKIYSETMDNKLNIYLKCETDGLKRQRIFVGKNQANPTLRDWEEVPCKISANENYNFMATVDIAAGDSLINFFGEASYRDCTLTTAIGGVKPALQGNAQLKKLVYNCMVSGKDSFTATFQRGVNDGELIMPDDAVTVKKGAFSLDGVHAECGALTSYKIFLQKKLLTADNHLKIDVNAECGAEIKAVFVSGSSTEAETRYYFSGVIESGEFWEKVIIRLSDIKTAEGVALRSWQDVDFVCFTADKSFLISSIIWL